VYIVDIRNHGQSFHDDDMKYESLVEDFRTLVNHHKIEKPSFIGHSLGGRIGMKWALDYPSELEKLVVLDILPFKSKKFVPNRLDFYKEAFNLLNQTRLSSITEGIQVLQANIPEEAVREHIARNLIFDSRTHSFRWVSNIEAILANMNYLTETDITGTKQNATDTPTLLIAGKKSEYVAEEDIPEMQKSFKNLQVHWLNTGHWVQAEDPRGFLDVVNDFLKKELIIRML
jgi:esterase